MMKIVLIYFFLANTIWASGFNAPDEGLHWREVQTIQKEVTTLYDQVLREHLESYLRGKLKFTATSCQIRLPEIGCLTFRKKGRTAQIEVDFIAAKMVHLRGFGRLTLQQAQKRTRSLKLEDSQNRMILFPIVEKMLQFPVIPLNQGTIDFEALRKIETEVQALYTGTLQRTMKRYSGEQWRYPLDRCDTNLLELGCVTYAKISGYWMLSIQLEEALSQDLQGFDQLILRKRNDGLGELELRATEGRHLFFPTVNDQLKDLFIPTDL